MLAAVVEHFLDRVTERDFDAPFIALLLKLDFTNIHYLHGQYEFGKDFIAQASVGGQQVQYVFQSKLVRELPCFASATIARITPRLLASGTEKGQRPILGRRYRPLSPASAALDVVALMLELLVPGPSPPGL